MKLIKMQQETAQPEEVSPVKQGEHSQMGSILDSVRTLNVRRSRAWSCLVAVSLVILLIPYLRVALALSRRVLPSFVGVAVAPLSIIGVLGLVLIALLRPVWALTLFFALAPLANGLAAWLVLGNPARHHLAGMFWVEPLFLSLAIGLLLGRTCRSEPIESKRLDVAVGFYAIVVLTSLALFFFQSPWWWDRLTLAWLHIPRVRQLSPNHPLRAGLLILASLLCYRLTCNRLITSKEIQLVCRTWLAGGLLTGLYGLWMWTRGEGILYPRIESVFDDANSYGSYLVLTLFIAWGEFLVEKELWARAMAVLTLLFTVWMIPLAGSRIAIIAAAAGVGIAWTTLARSRRARWIRGYFLVALVSVMLVFPLLGGRKVIEQMLPDNSEPASWRVNRIVQAMDARLVVKAWQEFHQALWVAGLRMVVDKPAFGHGPGVFYAELGDYYGPGNAPALRGPGAPARLPPHENAHNYFIQVAAETGLLGLAGFLWCVGTVMVSGFTRALSGAGLRTWLLTIGVGSYLLTALAQHPLALSEQALLFWGYLGILGACSRLGQDPATASGLA